MGAYLNSAISVICHQERLHEGVEVTVEHTLCVGGFHARAHVFHHFVGVQHVRAYLAAPFDLFLLALELRLLCLAFLELDVVETALEDEEGPLAVVLLAAGFGVLHHDAGGQMPHAHPRFHLVHVLAAVAAAAEGVPLEVGRVDFDVYRVVYKRVDEDAAEGCLTLALSVERGDAHKAVHAALGLEPAVGVVALVLDGVLLEG